VTAVLTVMLTCPFCGPCRHRDHADRPVRVLLRMRAKTPRRITRRSPFGELLRLAGRPLEGSDARRAVVLDDAHAARTSKECLGLAPARDLCQGTQPSARLGRLRDEPILSTQSRPPTGFVQTEADARSRRLSRTRGG